MCNCANCWIAAWKPAKTRCVSILCVKPVATRWKRSAARRPANRNFFWSDLDPSEQRSKPLCWQGCSLGRSGGSCPLGDQCKSRGQRRPPGPNRACLRWKTDSFHNPIAADARWWDKMYKNRLPPQAGCPIGIGQHAKWPEWSASTARFPCLRSEAPKAALKHETPLEGLRQPERGIETVLPGDDSSSADTRTTRSRD